MSRARFQQVTHNPQETWDHMQIRLLSPGARTFIAGLPSKRRMLSSRTCTDIMLADASKRGAKCRTRKPFDEQLLHRLVPAPLLILHKEVLISRNTGLS